MQAERPIFLELESWFREFANENEIQIIGSYDGGRVGCSGDEFYDGMHPKSSCMVKLLANSNE